MSHNACAAVAPEDILADRLLLQATEVELYEMDNDFSPLVVCVVLLAP